MQCFSGKDSSNLDLKFKAYFFSSSNNGNTAQIGTLTYSIALTIGDIVLSPTTKAPFLILALPKVGITNNEAKIFFDFGGNSNNIYNLNFHNKK